MAFTPTRLALQYFGRTLRLGDVVVCTEQRPLLELQPSKFEMRTGTSQFTRRTSQSRLLVLVELRTNCFDLLFDKKTLCAAEESANRAYEKGPQHPPRKNCRAFHLSPLRAFSASARRGSIRCNGSPPSQSFLSNDCESFCLDGQVDGRLKIRIALFFPGFL